MAQATIGTSTSANTIPRGSGRGVLIASDGTAFALWSDGTNRNYSYASYPYTSWTTTTFSSGASTAMAAFLLSTDDIIVLMPVSNKPTYYLLTKSGTSWTLGTGTQISATSTVSPQAAQLVKDGQGRYWAMVGGTSNALVNVYETTTPTTATWATSLALSALAGDINQPASDLVGSYLVVLYTDASGVLKYQRIDVSGGSLGSWSTATAIANLGGSPSAPSWSFKALDATHGLFVYSSTLGIYAQTYDSGGDSWSSAAQLSTTANDKLPTLATDRNGKAWVIWCGYQAANNYTLTMKRYDGVSWGAAETLVAAGTNVNMPNAEYHATAGVLGIAYQTGTASPWNALWLSMSSLTRVITPVSGALQATGTRSVPASGALSTPSLTRTIPLTTPLLTSPSRSVGATVALIGTLTRTLPLTTPLLASLTRTLPLTTPLLASASRSLPLTTPLLASASRSLTGTGALSSTASRSLTGTGALIGTASRTIPLTTPLLTSASRSLPLTTPLLASLTRTLPLTTPLLASASRTLTGTGALLTQNGRVMVSTGSLVLLGATRPLTADASLFVPDQPRALGAAVALLTEGTRAMGVTVAVLATPVRAVGATSVLLIERERAVGATSALLIERGRAMGADVSLSGGGRTLAASASMLAQGSRGVDASGAVQATLARPVSASAALLVLARSVSASAALLVLARTRPIPSQATLWLSGQERPIGTEVAVRAEEARAIPATLSIAAPISRAMPVTVALRAEGVRAMSVRACLSEMGKQRTLGATVAVQQPARQRTISLTAALLAATLSILITNGQVESRLSGSSVTVMISSGVMAVQPETLAGESGASGTAITLLDVSVSLV